MIPLSQLITPITPVGAGSRGQMGAALGDLGDFLANQQERDRQFSQKQLDDYQKWLDAAEHRGLQRQHQESTDRYYDAQTALHRDQLTEKQDAAKQRQLQKLSEDFRKAKTPEQRELVRQNLQALGYTVGESETDLPAEPEAPVPQEKAPAKMPVAPGGYANPPKANPKFAAQLGEFMASPEAQASTAEPAPTTSGESPFPWDIAGFPEPKIKPEKPARGGKFTVTDAKGNKVLEHDEPLQQQKMRQEILRIGEPLIKDARNEVNRDAADKAAQSAAEVYASTGDAQLAVHHFETVYKSEVGQFKTEHRGGGGGPAGPTKTDIKLAERDASLVNQVITRVGGQYEMKDLDKSMTMAKQSLASMNEQTGLGDLDSVKQYMRAMSGLVVTDREMNQFMSSSGKWVGWEKKYNEYMNEGRFPPEFLRSLQSLMQRTLSRAEEKRKELGDNAYQQVLGLKGSTDAAKVARGHFTGRYDDMGEVAPLGQSRSRGAAKPTAGGKTGRQRADEILERMGVK